MSPGIRFVLRYKVVDKVRRGVEPLLIVDPWRRSVKESVRQRAGSASRRRSFGQLSGPPSFFIFHRICLYIPNHNSASFDDKPNRRTIRRTRCSVEATEIGFT